MNILRSIVLAVLVTHAAYAGPPGWWNDELTRILDPNAAQNNLGVLNLGQLKFVATAAKSHLDFSLAPQGGAGAAVDALVASFSTDAPETNYSPANLGQLKAIGKPFFNRLLAVGYNTKQNLVARGYPGTWAFNYPWDPATLPSENYKPGSVGQLKMVFSFDLLLDTNTDGTPDWHTSILDTDRDGVTDLWEIANGFNHLVFNNFYSDDFDGDGFKDGYELWAGTDPRNASSKPTVGTPTGSEELPAMLDDVAYVVAGYSVTISPLSNDSLPDGTFIITSLTQPNSTLGKVSSNGTQIFFVAQPGVSGQTVFTYHIGNPSGVSASAQVVVNVRASNNPPVTIHDTVSVEIGSAVNIDVLANDHDYNGEGSYTEDAMTVTLEPSAAEDDAVVQEGGIIHYRPSQEIPGLVTLIYRATDTFGASSTAVVDINVVESLAIPPEEIEAAWLRSAPLAAPPAGMQTRTYYVSYDLGHDTNNSGMTPEAPFKKVEKAKTSATTYLNGLGEAACVTIKLMKGKHPLRSENPLQPPGVVEPGLKFRYGDIPNNSTIIFTVASDVTPQNPAILTGALEFWQNHGGKWTDASQQGNGIKQFIFEPSDIDEGGKAAKELKDRVNALRSWRSQYLGGPPDKSPTFTQLFVENTVNGKISRKTRAREPDVAANADTSRFTYRRPGLAEDPLEQSPLRRQEPIVRFPDGTIPLAGVANGNTEVVFTRDWMNPRGIIGTFTVNDRGSHYTAFTIPAMKNPVVFAPPPAPPETPERFTYDEPDLAEINAVTALDNPANFEPDTFPVTVAGTVKVTEHEDWNRGWLENNLNFLDKEGEWYLDDKVDDYGMLIGLILYYKPKANENVLLSTLKFQIPVTFTLISIEGNAGGTGQADQTISGIKFIGPSTANIRSSNDIVDSNDPAASNVLPSAYFLKFRYGAWQYENGRTYWDGIYGPRNNEFYSFGLGGYGLSGVIDGKYLDRLEVKGCEFSYYGNSAISLGGNRSHNQGVSDEDRHYAQPRGRVTNVSIVGNYISDGGGGGVRIDDFPKLVRDSRGFRQLPLGQYGGVDNNVVDNNSINRVGVCFADAPPITIKHGFNTRVTRNNVAPSPGLGIVIGTKSPRSPREGIIVQDNTVRGSMQRLVDGGGLYTPGQRSTFIIGNKFRNIAAFRTSDDAIVRPGYFESAADFGLLFTDVYLDQISAGAVLKGNVAEKGALLKVKFHPDMEGRGHNLHNVGQELHNLKRQENWEPHKKQAGLQANRSPSGQEDPATAGCGAERIEAEAVGVVMSGQVDWEPLHHSHASPSTPAGVHNHVKFTPNAVNKITFKLPNPEPTPALGGKDNVWYNFKIGMIRNTSHGKCQIKFGDPAANPPPPFVFAYRTNSPIVVKQNVEILGTKENIDKRITQHQVRWNVKATAGTHVFVTFVSVDNLPLTFDYFEFYRSADQD